MLANALKILRTDWPALAANALQNQLVFWVGSGASREKFPALPALILQLLEKLQINQDATNPNCPYFDAATKIVSLSTVTGIDLRLSPSAWDPIKRADLINQLVNQYSGVLGIQLNLMGIGKSLPWDFLKLQKVYSDPKVEPDADHRFIALLIAEGALTEVITTNWDSLIEQAYSDLDCLPNIEVIACNSELNRSAQKSMVFKIHGCAKKMDSNPAQYRSNMVATANDIVSWSVKEHFRPFREQVSTMLRARPAIFVGISGQDFNLQAECVVSTVGGITYPVSPPRIVFTVNKIDAPQRNILQGIYGEDYNSHIDIIEREAALPLYAKPLLGAIFTLLVLDKLKCLLEIGQVEFPHDDFRACAHKQIDALEILLNKHFAAITNPINYWREFSMLVPAYISRILGLYRFQTLPTKKEVYFSITSMPSKMMRVNPDLPVLCNHWLILSLALFLEGQACGVWNLAPSNMLTGEDGQIRAVIPGGTEVDIFLAQRDSNGIHNLEHFGSIRCGSGRRILIIYPLGTKPLTLRRSPMRRLPGIRVLPAIAEIYLQDTTNAGLTIRNTLDLLRSEMIKVAPL